MAQTYAQLQKQIAQLEAQASQLRQAEVKEVIGKIKDAIQVYGLTPADLFGNKSVGIAPRQQARAVSQYADDKGNTWGGRGPRPQWLRDALAAGMPIEAFKVAGAAKAPGGASAKRATKAPPKAATNEGRRIKYKDDAGNAWSGFGPKPKWLRDALDAGKTLEQMRA